MTIRGIWETGLSPFTGFGDDPNTSIKFGILRNRDGSLPNWQGGHAKLSEFSINNSSDMVYQHHGYEQYELVARLWFPTQADLRNMRMVGGRQATLRYAWDITDPLDGTKETRGDRSYLVLPNTLLVRIEPDDTPTNGHPEATATFRRAVGVGTLYDYALYAEDE